MHPGKIRKDFIAFQRSRILLTAFELDVFSCLEKPATSEEVAQRVSADARAMDRLLNALVAIGYIDKKENTFQNKDFCNEYLVRGKDEYISGFAHSASMWHAWSLLTDSVKTGTSVAQPSLKNKNDKWLESFIEAMHDRAMQQTAETTKHINLNNAGTLLDVGGGSGVFAMAFIKAKPGLTATVFDLPNVIPITQKYIEKEGYAGKIVTQSGDYLEDDFKGSFDIIFLSAVIHSNSFAQNKKLILNCAKAMAPGAQLIVQDFIMDESRTEPMKGAIFALNMLVGTKEGDTFTEKEVISWMEDAGLIFDQRINQSFGTAQIIGKKK